MIPDINHFNIIEWTEGVYGEVSLGESETVLSETQGADVRLCWFSLVPYMTLPLKVKSKRLY